MCIFRCVWCIAQVCMEPEDNLEYHPQECCTQTLRWDSPGSGADELVLIIEAGWPVSTKHLPLSASPLHPAFYTLTEDQTLVLRSILLTESSLPSVRFSFGLIKLMECVVVVPSFRGGRQWWLTRWVGIGQGISCKPV